MACECDTGRMPMRRIARLIASAACVATCVVPLMAVHSLATAPGGELFDPGLPAASGDAVPAAQRVIVRFDSGADRAERAALRDDADVSKLAGIASVPGLEVAAVQPGQSAADAAAELEQSDAVLYAEPDGVHRLVSIPDDEYFDLLWGLDNFGQDPDGPSGSAPTGTAGADINAPAAWDLYDAGPTVPVTVAVGDSGIYEPHDDLDANIWQNSDEIGSGKETNGVDDDGNGYIDDTHGWDWVSSSSGCQGDPNPNPPVFSEPVTTITGSSYHGTHVASTIAAERDNGIGVAGVNGDAQLMNLRIADPNGNILISDELCAMQYAVGNDAAVFNGSFGGTFLSEGLRDFIAANPQTLFVFAAGNEARDVEVTPTYPCAYPAANIICVAASTNLDTLADFSNFGDTAVDLAAPGDTIAGALNSTSGNLYIYLDGTSMATPHVAGAASLLLSRYPALTPPEVKDALLAGVDQLATFHCATLTGGRLNLERSMQIAADAVTPPVADVCDSSNSGGGGGGGTGTQPPANTPAIDVFPPFASVSASNGPNLALHGSFSFRTFCSENCTLDYTVTVSRRGGVFTGKANGVAGQTTKVIVRTSGTKRTRLRRVLRRGPAKIKIAVKARDASGNAASTVTTTALLHR